MAGMDPQKRNKFIFNLHIIYVIYLFLAFCSLNAYIYLYILHTSYTEIHTP